MTRIYKTLALTLAVVLTVSIVGKQVKAVAGGVVAAGTASVAASVAFTLFFCEVVYEICETIANAVSAYEDETGKKTDLSEEERLQLSEQSKEEITSYMNQRQQEVLAEGYYDLHYADMTDQERMSYFINAQMYFDSISDNPSAAQRVVGASISALENHASEIVMGSDGSITLSSSDFVSYYNEVLQKSISDVTGLQVLIDQDNNRSLREIAMSAPTTNYFPSLTSIYGASQVYTIDNSNNPKNFIEYPYSQINSTLYYVYIRNGTLASENIFYSDFSSPERAVDYFQIRAYYTNSNYQFEVVTYYLTGKPSSSTSYNTVVGTEWAGKPIYSNSVRLAVDFGGSYIFEFKDLASAQAFLSDIVADSEKLASYNPVDDTIDNYDDPPVVADTNLSSIEKAIESQKESLGVDVIDVTVNPGVVEEEDGSISYNPSISVGGTDVRDLLNTGSDSKDDTDSKSEAFEIDISESIDKFKTPNSITTKFPFSIPFDIYHIFNIFSADPVAPSFDVSFDLTAVGAENYEFVIDLSDYEWIANIVRWIIYAIFLVGLAILTNKVIGRG